MHNTDQFLVYKHIPQLHATCLIICTFRGEIQKSEYQISSLVACRDASFD